MIKSRQALEKFSRPKEHRTPVNLSTIFQEIANFQKELDSPEVAG
jgi:hypothetical protein